MVHFTYYRRSGWRGSDVILRQHLDRLCSKVSLSALDGRVPDYTEHGSCYNLRSINFHALFCGVVKSFFYMVCQRVSFLKYVTAAQFLSLL
jgi:hypothetical protein